MKQIIWNNQYRLFVIITVIYLLSSILLRFTLWWQFSPENHPFLHIPLIIVLGIINDIILLTYLLLPFSLLLLVLPLSWLQKSRGRGLLTLTLCLSVYGLLFLNITEFYFFEEFNARFNLVAVDYLIYPHEVFINIWESYPVALWLIFNLLIIMILSYPLWLLTRSNQNLFFKQRARVFTFHVLLIVLVSRFISTDSFAISEDRVINEIASNGISSFFKASKTNQLDYPIYYATQNFDTSFQRLTTELAKGGGQFTHLAEYRLDRHFATRPQGLGKLNIVVIVEESFGAEFIGSYGDQRHLTPEFDQLAQKGMLFEHAWATGTRTVRGLEAITLSFPPIPSESVIKRPGNENMANWGKVMQTAGYHTSFIYGGYGYFDNMNYFYSHNDFTVSDRTDIHSPKFANIWGVSDEDLLHHATDYYDHLSTLQQPFFSIIMTTSNHKPFTFPEGIPGIPSHGGGREAGIRYADYALGRFFEEVQHHEWFEQTLFVIVADHGARVYGKAEIPLQSYEIPLLILAPHHLAPSKIEREISQLDIAPTLLGLLGLEYEAPFFGQNIFNRPVTEPIPLLFNHNYTVALLEGNELAILGLQKAESTEHYDPKNHDLTVAKRDQSQIDLAIAYYQVAFEQFSHHWYQ